MFYLYRIYTELFSPTEPQACGLFKYVKSLFLDLKPLLQAEIKFHAQGNNHMSKTVLSRLKPATLRDYKSSTLNRSTMSILLKLYTVHKEEYANQARALV